MLYLLVSLGTLGATNWGRLSTDFLIAAVGVAVAVGFAEEFVCRGVLLVGLRGSVREVGMADHLPAVRPHARDQHPAGSAGR